MCKGRDHGSPTSSRSNIPEYNFIPTADWKDPGSGQQEQQRHQEAEKGLHQQLDHSFNSRTSSAMTTLANASLPRWSSEYTSGRGEGENVKHLTLLSVFFSYVTPASKQLAYQPQVVVE
jgi:hypothetical protein